MENCVFCNIIAGDIPASKLYEDENVLAFLDISQTTKGHALVIPKEHSRNVLELSEQTAANLFARVPKIARGLKKAMHANGINIINNNEEIAGQTVFHTHIHLIPRYDQADEITITYTAHEPDFQQLARLAKTIQEEVSYES